MTAAAAHAVPEMREFRRLGTVLFVLGLTFAVMFVDSRWVAARLPYNQWIANVVNLAVFVWMYRDAPPRLQQLMKYGVVVATLGEVVFSLWIGMYEYRLENVPLYVPLGHSILYAAVYYFVHEPFVLRRATQVTVVMLSLAVGYSLWWLWADNDVYGMVCTLGFLALIALNRDSRLFFLAMFLFVAYLEQVGTGFSCWYWHPTLLDRFEWFPSGNPPSGISIFYFGFDVACLWAYMARHPKIHERWRRLRDYRQGKGTLAGQELQPGVLPGSGS